MSETSEAPEATANPPGFVKLSKPIEAHGETRTSIVLRKPGPKDIRLTGSPFRVNVSDGSLSADMAVIHRYIVLLAGLPPSVVDQMESCDFFVAAGIVQNFFQAGQPG